MKPHFTQSPGPTVLALRGGWRWGFPGVRGTPPASLLLTHPGSRTGSWEQCPSEVSLDGPRAKDWSPPGAFLLKTSKSTFLLEVQPSSWAKGPVREVKSANVFVFQSVLSLLCSNGHPTSSYSSPPPSSFPPLPLSFLKQGLM